MGKRETRRHPEMEHYTMIEKQAGTYALWLKVGVQSFKIWDGFDTRKEALWMQDMLCIALARVVAEASPAPDALADGRGE